MANRAYFPPGTPRFRPSQGGGTSPRGIPAFTKYVKQAKASPTAGQAAALLRVPGSQGTSVRGCPPGMAYGSYIKTKPSTGSLWGGDYKPPSAVKTYGCIPWKSGNPKKPKNDIPHASQKTPAGGFPSLNYNSGWRVAHVHEWNGNYLIRTTSYKTGGPGPSYIIVPTSKLYAKIGAALKETHLAPHYGLLKIRDISGMHPVAKFGFIGMSPASSPYIEVHGKEGVVLKGEAKKIFLPSASVPNAKDTSLQGNPCTPPSITCADGRCVKSVTECDFKITSGSQAASRRAALRAPAGSAQEQLRRRLKASSGQLPGARQNMGGLGLRGSRNRALVGDVLSAKPWKGCADVQNNVVVGGALAGSPILAVLTVNEVNNTVYVVVSPSDGATPVRMWLSMCG